MTRFSGHLPLPEACGHIKCAQESFSMVMKAYNTELSASSDVPKSCSFVCMENFSTDSKLDSNTSK